MRVAALYDIHGNLPALEAVLREVGDAGVDLVIVGGDVFPGPMAVEALELLRGLAIPTQFIRGNGDRETLAMREGQETAAVPEAHRPSMRWGAEQLSAEQVRFVGSWPLTVRVEVAGLGDVVFCHATPRNDVDIFTRLTREAPLVPIFAGANAPIVVCGHSHMQFDRMIGQVRVVNAGSVGMPFGPAGADWLLLDPGIQLRHTAYDLAAAALRIRATPYPMAEEFAATYVMNPPTEDVILKAFAHAEVK
ncbi:MAG: metallophosphoesterase family protein [Vicinamibacterales bacterium]